ncbi:hypothetical protein DL96DRAFT_1704309 [Flagelloscypha sp. PMI_526]|nr:hypothetical protein DL96DRAFT_1704309 [Flagelloscypha sp. PMI_526]
MASIRLNARPGTSLVLKHSESQGYNVSIESTGSNDDEPGMELLVKTIGEEVHLELHRTGAFRVPQMRTSITEGSRASNNMIVPIASTRFDQQFPVAQHEEMFGDIIPQPSQHLVPPTQFSDTFGVLPSSSLDQFGMMHQSWMSPIDFCDPQASDADSLPSSSATPEDMDSTSPPPESCNSDTQNDPNSGTLPCRENCVYRSAA